MVLSSSFVTLSVILCKILRGISEILTKDNSRKVGSVIVLFTATCILVLNSDHFADIGNKRINFCNCRECRRILGRFDFSRLQNLESTPMGTIRII